jgi:hypothetical protein
MTPEYKSSLRTNGYHDPLRSADSVKESAIFSGRGRPLKILCIGAGAAGIYIGLRLPRELGNQIDLQVRVRSLLLVNRGAHDRIDRGKEPRLRRMLVREPLS